MPHTWHDGDEDVVSGALAISIHMPHTWHDQDAFADAIGLGNFNPHATYVA